VLIAGGPEKTGAELKTAEVNDPIAQTFTLTAKKQKIARTLHTATLLGDGEVLIASGFGVNGTTTGNVKLYDPTTNKFLSAKGVKHSRFAATATLLNSGDVPAPAATTFRRPVQCYRSTIPRPTQLP
jgi:hypothetical protein